MRIHKRLEAHSAAALDRLIERYHEKYPYVYGVEVLRRYKEGRKHVAIMARYSSAD